MQRRQVRNRSRHRRSRTIVALLLLAAAVAPIATTAQSGGTYTMRKSVIAGGERASGGTFVLVGTVAQSAAGVSAADAYILQSGFHAAADPVVPPSEAVFCHGFEDAPCP